MKHLLFIPTGDSVTFDEVIDFLLEFNVIVNNRICTERQISAIVQASFPGVVTKPSAKYNVIFVNLENNSDDVIKEELVRVTTEPIVDPVSREAQAWIEEEDEGMESSDAEDNELSEIENKKMQNDAHRATTNITPLIEQSPTQQSNSDVPGEEKKIYTGTPRYVTDGRQQQQEPQDNSSPSYQERGVDVSFIDRSSNFKENLNNNRSFSKSTGDVRSGSGLRRNPSFTKRGIDRSVSVSDVAKRFENDKDMNETNEDKKESSVTITKATSTSNLQRKRSFTKSTNPTFVGTIRDKFRSSLRRKSKNENAEKEKETTKENNKKGKEESEKKKAKEENEKKTNVVVKRGTSTRASFTVKTNTEKQATSAATKIGPNNEVKMSVRNKARAADNNRFGGSTMDVSNHTHQGTPTKSVNKSLSGSAGDIRASFRTNSARSVQNNNNKAEVKASFNTTSTRQSVNRSASEYNHSNAAENIPASAPPPQEKSNFVRATTFKTDDPRSSVRRNITSSTTDVRSSVRKSNDNRPVVTKSASVRNNNNNATNTNTSSRNQSARTLTPRDNNTAKRTGAGLRRSNSRASSIKGSNQSSANSTPNISRENSKTNMKIPIRRQPGSTVTNNKLHQQQPRKIVTATTQEEKDILRIAKAFQKATDDIEKAKDNVEQFMINVALDDIKPSPNDRLCVDDLYDHIRHRMVMSQEQIFDGYRSDIRVDMSQYFELFFTALASNMSRVGCEIVTDSTTQQKVCYLTHVKLMKDYTNGVVVGSEQQQTESDDDMQSSYV